MPSAWRNRSSLRCGSNQRPLNLPPWNTIVSHPTDKPQDEFSLVLVIRENITPTQQAIRLLNLFFRRMINVVLNRGL